MFQKLTKLDPVVHIILIVSVIAIFLFLLKLERDVRLLSQKEPSKVETIREIETNTQTVKGTDERKISKMISDAIATLSGVPKVVSQKQTITAISGNRTSYIPMGSTAATKSTDWVDVKDSEVYIDLKNDFGENAYVTFEVSLKVANANGQAFARLYDATNKIAVNGSEVSTTNNADYARESSDKLNLWSGRNLYRVQIKSLNSLEVTYSNGKVKIVY